LIESAAGKGFGLNLKTLGSTTFQLHFLEFSDDGYTATTGLMPATSATP